MIFVLSFHTIQYSPISQFFSKTVSEENPLFLQWLVSNSNLVLMQILIGMDSSYQKQEVKIVTIL